MTDKHIVMVQHIDGKQDMAPIDPTSQKWSTNSEREAWKQEAAENGARLAEAMVDECHKWQDQTADYNAFNGIIEASIDLEDTPRDWKDLRGDCAL